MGRGRFEVTTRGQVDSNVYSEQVGYQGLDGWRGFEQTAEDGMGQIGERGATIHGLFFDAIPV